jgi:ATP-binding cassette, subfamily B, bacterial PglK
MYNSLKKLYIEFSAKEKRRLFLLALVIILTALIQVVGIASIFPFISVASNPDIIDSNKYLSFVKTILGIENNQQFLIILGGTVLLTLVLTNSFLAFSQWLTAKFLALTVHNLTYQMFQRYLYEAYEFHLYRNSAELLKNLTAEVGRVVNGGIMSTITMISSGFTALCILILLVIVDPSIAFTVCLVLGGLYGLIFWIVRVKLSWIGHEMTRLMSERMKYYNESLGGIKELMVLGRVGHYLSRFSTNSEEIVKHKIYANAVMELPRYLIEIVSFGGVLSITIYIVAIKGDTETALPMIALYGFAGYRLMPALQNLFKSAATLKHDIAAVDLFYDDLHSTNETRHNRSQIDPIKGNTIPFNHSLIFNDISYQYPSASRPAVNGVSLSIKANTSIGIVGSSGSGKSTLIDIMLGLLKPQQGELTVDGLKLGDENTREWQNNIGYVSQAIFLADSTISENIAFGVTEDDIDMNAVIKAAKMANLHDFIVNDLEGGYRAIVGERGVRLSGGQRQRIGIARALYHDPAVLILDEATSALDSPTEQSIIEAVYRIADRKTIIMIAHRLTTIKLCDEIIIMDKGVILDRGRYDDLSETSESFRKLQLKQGFGEKVN